MVAWVPPSYAHIYSLLASLGFFDSAELLLVVVMTVRFLSLLRARRNNRMRPKKKGDRRNKPLTLSTLNENLRSLFDSLPLHTARRRDCNHRGFV
jgi:hypothetical protein